MSGVMEAMKVTSRVLALIMVWRVGQVVMGPLVVGV